MQRRLLYSVFGILLATGFYWALVHYLGFPPYPGEPLLMKLHGAAAMAALVIVGGLLYAHVPSGWAELRSRASGGTMLATCGLLAVTGHLLYYTGDETARAISSYVHLAFGLAFPIALAVHLAVKPLRQPAAPAAASQPNLDPKELAEWKPPSGT
jgi:hypothetical protein